MLTIHLKPVISAVFVPLILAFAIVGLVLVAVTMTGTGSGILGMSFLSAPMATFPAQLIGVTATAFQKEAQSAVIVIAPPVVPQLAHARLVIPKIDVDARIDEMGITSGGAMAVPGNNIDVGWFKFGTRPGDVGSAVIGGHNRWNFGVAVFDRLNELQAGDTVSVTDAQGITRHFVVRIMRTFAADDTNSGIFESVTGIHLNLVTCSGIWDPRTNSYPQRLVVFTDIVTTW